MNKYNNFSYVIYSFFIISSLYMYLGEILMNLKSECLSYSENAKIELNKAFPQNKQQIEILFKRISDFLNDDYKGISDNKIYRLYLCLLKDLIIISFENNVSKSFMRSFFKRLENKIVIDYLSSLTKKQILDFNSPLDRLVNEFVYWQDSDHNKELKLNHWINLIDDWM